MDEVFLLREVFNHMYTFNMACPTAHYMVPSCVDVERAQSTAKHVLLLTTEVKCHQVRTAASLGK